MKKQLSLAMTLTVALASPVANSQDALYIDQSGDVGLGTNTPAANLHLYRSGGLPRMLWDNADYTNPHSTDGDWFMDVSDNGDFRISLLGSGAQEFMIDVDTGDLLILGNYRSNGTALNVPDYVFAEDYKLRPIDELKSFIAKNKHLPNVPSADDINANGLNMTAFQMVLLEKVEELTLYSLNQHDKINQQEQAIEALKQEIEQLKLEAN